MSMIPNELLPECVEDCTDQDLRSALPFPTASINSDLSSESTGSPATEDPPSSHSSPAITQTDIPEIEVRYYYAGLPSAPILVARTSDTPWEQPRGWGSYPKSKELRPVGNHPLQDVWKSKLGPKFLQLLKSIMVQWTSVDVVRIGYVGESDAPVVIWIGAMPGSLSGYDGRDAALKCRKLLLDHDILDVDVEIRESLAIRLGNPPFMSSGLIQDPTVTFRDPFTTTLGTPITRRFMPWEGSSGFFILEGKENKRLLLVTARHVIFGSRKDNDQPFAYKNSSQPRQCVTIFSEDGFKQFVAAIKDKIQKKKEVIRESEAQIKDTEGLDNWSAVHQRDVAQNVVKKEKSEVNRLHTFHQEVLGQWAPVASRTIGHVVLSPPIAASVGSSEEGYTEDWAVVEVDRPRIDKSDFIGNVIDLGVAITRENFTKMMHPHPSNPNCFEYPPGRLLKLRGTIPEDEMRSPTARDEKGNHCTMVLKRGRTTGVTIGRANTIFSYARYLDDSGAEEHSEEWAILPSYPSSGFSATGDSGSAIVDGRGRIGGLLTGGTGHGNHMDITYATPADFLLRRMSRAGLDKPHIYLPSAT